MSSTPPANAFITMSAPLPFAALLPSPKMLRFFADFGPAGEGRAKAAEAISKAAPPFRGHAAARRCTQHRRGFSPADPCGGRPVVCRFGLSFDELHRRRGGAHHRFAGIFSAFVGDGGVHVGAAAARDGPVSCSYCAFERLEWCRRAGRQARRYRRLAENHRRQRRHSCRSGKTRSRQSGHCCRPARRRPAIRAGQGADGRYRRDPEGRRRHARRAPASCRAATTTSFRRSGKRRAKIATPRCAIFWMRRSGSSRTRLSSRFKRRSRGFATTSARLEDLNVKLKEKQLVAPKDATLPGILTDTVASIRGGDRREQQKDRSQPRPDQGSKGRNCSGAEDLRHRARRPASSTCFSTACSQAISCGSSRCSTPRR